MPSRFILQGLDRENDHIAGLEQVFSLKPITNGIVATAFMNAAGAYLLADLISEDADRIDIYVGVRNGVTSKQALETLMRSGIYPYVIDTASQAYIFHPKVFLASNDEMARLIVGSANVTSGGMAKNVEASLYSELSMRTDLELINSIYYQFESLKTQFPDNIFHVSLTDLNVMTEQGLLIDETKAAWKAAAGVRGNGRSDDRQRMRLKTRSMPRPERIANTPVQVVHIEGTELDIPRRNRLLLYDHLATAPGWIGNTGQQFNKIVTFIKNHGHARLWRMSIPFLVFFFHCVSLPSAVQYTAFSRDTAPPLQCDRSYRRRKHTMSDFMRGQKVITVFGEGVVVNLPVCNRIAVRYEDNTIRFFFPEDVVTGRIRPAA